jgi:hypothetical protein
MDCGSSVAADGDAVSEVHVASNNPHINGQRRAIHPPCDFHAQYIDEPDMQAVDLNISLWQVLTAVVLCDGVFVVTQHVRLSNH